MITYQNPFQRWLWESGAAHILLGVAVVFFFLYGVFWVYDSFTQRSREREKQRKRKNH